MSRKTSRASTSIHRRREIHTGNITAGAIVQSPKNITAKADGHNLRIIADLPGTANYEARSLVIPGRVAYISQEGNVHWRKVTYTPKHAGWVRAWPPGEVGPEHAIPRNIRVRQRGGELHFKATFLGGVKFTGKAPIESGNAFLNPYAQIFWLPKGVEPKGKNCVKVWSPPERPKRKRAQGERMGIRPSPGIIPPKKSKG